MSIYIQDMAMPTGCAFCKIKRRNGSRMVCPLCDEEWDIHDPMSADHRLDNCPLVPVPEHGRLIDADALLKKAHYRMGIKPGGIDEVEAFIRVTDLMEAPTIIPADKLFGKSEQLAEEGEA